MVGRSGVSAMLFVVGVLVKLRGGGGRDGGVWMGLRNCWRAIEFEGLDKITRLWRHL